MQIRGNSIGSGPMIWWRSEIVHHELIIGCCWANNRILDSNIIYNQILLFLDYRFWTRNSRKPIKGSKVSDHSLVLKLESKFHFCGWCPGPSNLSQNDLKPFHFWRHPQKIQNTNLFNIIWAFEQQSSANCLTSHGFANWRSAKVYAQRGLKVGFRSTNISYTSAKVVIYFRFLSPLPSVSAFPFTVLCTHGRCDDNHGASIVHFNIRQHYLLYFIHSMFSTMQHFGCHLQEWFDYGLNFAKFFFFISTCAISRRQRNFLLTKSFSPDDWRTFYCLHKYSCSFFKNWKYFFNEDRVSFVNDSAILKEQISGCDI